MTAATIRAFTHCPECGRAARTGETKCANCGDSLVMTPEEQVAWAKRSIVELPIIQQVAAFFVGVFCYVISYGLVLTFGLVALLGFGIGFATLPSAGDLLFPDASPSSSIFATATPARPGQATAPAKTTTADEGGSPWNAARTFIRLIVFGAAFLAIWPGWYGGYTVFSRLRADATS